MDDLTRSRVLPRWLCLLVLLVGGVAFADDVLDEVRQHFVRGTELYRAGRFGDAIVEFEAAYKLKDDPDLLYNLAVAERAAGHLNEAIRDFRGYLRQVPTAAERAAIEKSLTEMEKGVAPPSEPETDTVAELPQSLGGTPPPAPAPVPVEAPAAPAPVAAPAPAPSTAAPATGAPSKSGRVLKWTGVGMIAAGAVIAIAGGVGFGVASANAWSRILDQAHSGRPFDPSLDDSRHTYRALSTASYVVGAAVAVSGGALLYMGLRRDARGERRAGLRLAPLVGRGEAGLSVVGVF